jgi:hypothetical protein
MFWLLAGMPTYPRLFIFIVWLAIMLVGWVSQIDNKGIINAAFDFFIY